MKSAKIVDEDRIVINKTTPHLFMWFCNGKNCGENLPIPSGENLDYLSILRNNCQKAEESATPIILCYEGRLISEKQKLAIENIAIKEEFKNLFLVDYAEFNNDCLENPKHYEQEDSNESTFSDIIIGALAEFKKNSKKSDNSSVGSISYLVDSTRIHLLDRCDILKYHLIDKYKNNPYKKSLISESSNGLIYSDFDVSRENFTDIALNKSSQGLFCSTDMGFGNTLMPNRKKDSSVDIFNNKYLKNAEAIEKIKNIKNTMDQNLTSDEYLEYENDCKTINQSVQRAMSTAIGAIDNIRLENSLLGVNKENHPAMELAISYFTNLANMRISGQNRDTNDIPYDATRASIGFIYGGSKSDISSLHFGPLNNLVREKGFTVFDKFNLVDESILSNNHGYKVGNDGTWKTTRNIEYTTEVDSLLTTNPPQNIEITSASKAGQSENKDIFR